MAMTYCSCPAWWQQELLLLCVSGTCVIRELFSTSEIAWMVWNMHANIHFSRQWTQLTLQQISSLDEVVSRYDFGPLPESPGMLQFICVLSSRSCCPFSHLCEAAQSFMKSCCLAQKQACRLFQVRNQSTSVYSSAGIVHFLYPFKGNGYFL